MKSWMTLTMITLLSLPALADTLAGYPAQINGKKRVVLNLPQLPDAENYKVELVLALDLEKSDCNQKSLSGSLDLKRTAADAEYYEVNSDGGHSSTRMLCFDPPKPETIRGEGTVLPYPGRSPLVVYVTDLVFVQYRIFKTDGIYRDTN